MIYYGESIFDILYVDINNKIDFLNLRSDYLLWHKKDHFCSKFC